MASSADQQTAESANHVRNVAIIGVGGRSGTFIANALLDGQKHHVTAITRPDSTNTIPPGIHDTKKVNYDDHAALVQALKGQDVLIITMAVTAPTDSQTRLIDAAVAAGVKYIMPNEWGTDQSKVQASQDTMLHARLRPVRKYIEEKGGDRTHWIAVCCGFWYEFSLAGTEARYGFDFDKKTVTLFDDGNTKINTSTWPQVGRAVAALLSLPIQPPTTSATTSTAPASLSQYHNRSIYVSSFFVSQNDMLASVLRVTGDKASDWTVTHEDVVERYRRGLDLFQQQGQMVGFAIVLYSRIFFRDGAGDVNDKLDHDALGLTRQEDLDEATAVAVDMAKRGITNAVH